MAFFERCFSWCHRRFFIYLILFFLVVLITLFYFFQARLFPIRHIVIYSQLSDKAQTALQKQLVGVVHGGFFNVNMKVVQSILTAYPGIATAEIKRIWPDQLVINLSNQSALAMWNGMTFINSYGEPVVLQKGVDAKTLPQLHGPDDQQLQVLDYYQQSSDLLASLGLAINAVRLADSGVLSLRLSNGTLLELGDRFVLQRLQQFVSIYPNLMLGHKVSPYYVDMRYKNGMSVKW